MMYKGGEACIKAYSRVWTRGAGKTVALANDDIPPDWLTWADEIVWWKGNPGHHGLEQNRKHLKAVELAAALEGVTAVLDEDALVCHDLPVVEGEMVGSRLYQSSDFKNLDDCLCRQFVHPPYVATQDTWKRIEGVLGMWLRQNKLVDHGHNDLVLALAAQAAGVQVRAAGYSEQTVTDASALDAALSLKLPLIHGVKTPAMLRPWLEQNDLLVPLALWESYGIAPDTTVPMWAMDLRHVTLLQRLLELLRPKVAVEIGSYLGHSTCAFAAAQQKVGFDLHLVEIKPTPQLRSLIGLCASNTWLHTEPSWEANIKGDFVFIDGDHEWPALADLCHALSVNTPVIALHDTCNSLKQCWGSKLAADILRQAPGRTWYEDAETREGEDTHRGFGVSVLNNHPGIHQVFNQTLAETFPRIVRPAPAKLQPIKPARR